MNIINLTKNYDDTLSDLNLLWCRKNIDIEIDIVNGARPVESHEEKKIKEWVLQTPSKRKFALNVIRATMDNCHVTVKELVALHVASRQNIMPMAKEAEEAGWIKICRKNQTNKISANPIFVKAYITYCSWLANTYYTVELREILNSIRLLGRLKESRSSVTQHDT